MLSHEKMSEAVSSNVADIDMWAAHTHQLVAMLMQVQRTNEERERARAQDRAAAAAESLTRARCAKLEFALQAGVSVHEGRELNATFRRWAAAVGALWHESLEQRRGRALQLQERLASAGRNEMLDEHSRLLQDATKAGGAVQAMQGALHRRTQDLERTLLRDTMTFQLWSADAQRTSQMLRDIHATHQLELTQLRNQAASDRTRAAAAEVAVVEGARKEHAATAATLAGEVSLLERGGAVAAVRAVLGVRHTYLLLRMSRCWRAWATVASLPVREAHAALAALQLTSSQQHAVQTRLLGAQQAEGARLKVENLEARLLLHKADAIGRLRPAHQIATDKETLQEQSRQLADADAARNAALATLQSEQRANSQLRSDLMATESKLVAAQQISSDGRLDDERSLAVREMHDRLQYERTSQDFMAHEQQQAATQLVRAGCELRVLTAAIKGLELEAAAAARARAAAAPAAGSAPGPASPGASGARSAGAKSAAKPAAKRSLAGAATALKNNKPGAGRGRGGA